MGDRDGELGLVHIIVDHPKGFICANCLSEDIEIARTEHGAVVYCKKCHNAIEGIFDDNTR